MSEMQHLFNKEVYCFVQKFSDSWFPEKAFKCQNLCNMFLHWNFDIFYNVYNDAALSIKKKKQAVYFVANFFLSLYCFLCNLLSEIQKNQLKTDLNWG